MSFIRSIPISKTDFLVGMTVLLVTVVVVAGSRIFRLTNSKAIFSEEPVDLYLYEPVSLEDLSQRLEDVGVVDDREEVIWAGRLLGWNKFNQGYYQIEGGYSFDVLLSRMARGIQDPIQVTILPGLDRKRLVSTLTNQMKFDSLELIQALEDSVFLSEEGISEKALIGYIYPNTYSMYWTSSPKSVLKRVFREFNNAVIKPHKERFIELDKSVNEIITLASIIEWEASKNDEKKTVSGLYWNRLNRGMRLQADPTVNFAVKERRRLLYKDYQMAHPYNTYVNKGLPPGPITNPSLSSIEAALYPEDHDYLYMVASPNGYHVFTETFDEHRKESAKWRKWLREQYRIKEAREAEAADESDINS